MSYPQALPLQLQQQAAKHESDKQHAETTVAELQEKVDSLQALPQQLRAHDVQLAQQRADADTTVAELQKKVDDQEPIEPSARLSFCCSPPLEIPLYSRRFDRDGEGVRQQNDSRADGCRGTHSSRSAPSSCGTATWRPTSTS